MLALDTILQRIIRSAGFNLHRYRPVASESGRLVAMLANHGVNFVFDVGANIGQFSQPLRAAGYRERLVSFEPLSIANAQLLWVSQGDGQWEIAPQNFLQKLTVDAGDLRRESTC